MRAVGLTLLVLALSCTARAELLPSEARAIPVSDSASRNAPVVELAYGPTFQASFGGELGLYLRHRERFDFRLSLSGLAAYELQTTQYPPPNFLRTVVGLNGAFALKSPVFGGTLELSIGFYSTWATSLGNTEAPVLSPGEIPFGGGGVYLLPELAWRRDFKRWELTLRVAERIDLSTLPLAFGQRVAGDVAAAALDDALTNEPSAEAVLRWRLTERWQPLASFHADGLFPYDETARVGYFVRALVGVAIRGSASELIPFLSSDLGNGQGPLINERAIRFSAGVRYARF